jgi:predicted methyltransferase
MRVQLAFGLTALLVLLAGCKDPAAEQKVQIPIPDAAPLPTGPAIGTLEWAVDGAWRPTRDKARNPYRHPIKTLQFCGLAPNQNVLEVWPGGGWYTQILAPWLKENNGQYAAALLDPASSSRAQRLNASFKRAFSDTERYGEVTTRILGKKSGPLAPQDSLDLVLTFRNVHSWMAQGMAGKAFSDFYAALKPGGTLCVVEHQLPDAYEQDPLAASGYVQRALVKAMAKEAGFVFDAQSNVNANAKDNADHPFGVWTLPPVRRSAPAGETPDPNFDRQKYDAIGESNRMTLRFRKPDNASKESPDAP